MRKTTTIQLAASATGIVTLCSEVTLFTAYVLAGSDYIATAITCSLIASVVAVLAWTDKSRAYSTGSLSSGAWLGMCAVGFVVTLVFSYMDCGGSLPVFRPVFVCEGSPGLSAVLTISALGLTVIALPSALRAWILEKFKPSRTA